MQDVVQKLQQEKESPPCVPKIMQYIFENKLFGEGVLPGVLSHKGPGYASNRFYATPCLMYWSTERWNDEYKTYQERFQERYGDTYGYQLDRLNRVRPGPETQTVDYGQLIDILCSNDPSLLSENEALFTDLNHAKFLKKKADSTSGRTVSTEGNCISYSTFPRVGNTFLRKYL